MLDDHSLQRTLAPTSRIRTEDYVSDYSNPPCLKEDVNVPTTGFPFELPKSMRKPIRTLFIMGIVSAVGMFTIAFTHWYHLRSRVLESREILKHEMEQHPQDSTFQFVDRKICTALSFSNARTLRSPVIAIALLGSGGHLRIEWISDEPQADGIGLIDNDDRLKYELSFLPFYKSEFLQQQKRGVVYTALVDIPPPALRDISTLKVALVHRSIRVCTAVPILSRDAEGNIIGNGDH